MGIRTVGSDSRRADLLSDYHIHRPECFFRVAEKIFCFSPVGFLLVITISTAVDLFFGIRKKFFLFVVTNTAASR